MGDLEQRHGILHDQALAQESVERATSTVSQGQRFKKIPQGEPTEIVQAASKGTVFPCLF